MFQQFKVFLLKSISFQHFQSIKQIPNLDGLRGISILLVIFHHVPFVSGELLGNLQSHGKKGVYLFLAISGFIIATLALREYKKTGGFNLKNFYIRRSLRLFPLYYAVLLSACFFLLVLNLGDPAHRAAFVERLPSYFFYYSNVFGTVGAPLSILWSLAVEEQFYLFFSVIFFFFTKKSIVIFPLLLFLNLAVWPLSFIWGDYLPLTLFQYQQPTLCGVCLAFILHHQKPYAVFRHFFCYFPFFILLSILSFLALCLSTEYLEFISPLFNISCAIIVGISATFPPIPILGGPALSYVGKVSYGIYLLHMFVLYPIKHLISPNPFIVFLLGAPLSIAVAAVSYTYFEKPFLNLKQHFGSQVKR